MEGGRSALRGAYEEEIGLARQDETSVGDGWILGRFRADNPVQFRLATASRVGRFLPGMGTLLTPALL